MGDAHMARLTLFFLLVLLFSSPSRGQCAELHWYKGSLHCHTSVSDGDSSPQAVAAWYRGHGYSFAVITDHNRYTDVKSLNQFKDFLVMPGEEVSMNIGKQEYHVNGINTRRLVEPFHSGDGGELLRRAAEEIRKAGGIAQVNHPYCKGRLTENAIRSVDGVFLLEMHNAMVSTGAEHEMLWDNLLVKGMEIYGTASDDAHYYKPTGKSDWGHPGKGWVVVRAPDLTADAIATSLGKGDFYASTGVTLAGISAGPEEYRVEVKPEQGVRYTIAFIGMGGQVFQRTMGRAAAYHYMGVESYIRARVISSKGLMALTQPYFLRKRRLP
jgi:hypothetical protein